MFQLRHEDITYQDPTPTHDFGDKFLVQTLSVQIYEDDIPANPSKKLQKDPHTYVTSAIGADELDDKRTIRKERRQRPQCQGR